MLVKRIDNATRVMGAPPDWKDDGSQCVGLPIRDTPTDQGNFMVSAWEPTPAELTALNAGASIYLCIRGHNHPVVSLGVQGVTSVD